MGKYKKIKTNVDEEKDYIVSLGCVIVFFIVVIIILTMKANYYKKELDKAVELRQEDLKNINYWIKENNELKRQYETEKF